MEKSAQTKLKVATDIISFILVFYELVVGRILVHHYNGSPIAGDLVKLTLVLLGPTVFSLSWLVLRIFQSYGYDYFQDRQLRILITIGPLVAFLFCCYALTLMK